MAVAVGVVDVVCLATIIVSSCAQQAVSIVGIQNRGSGGLALLNHHASFFNICHGFTTMLLSH